MPSGTIVDQIVAVAPVQVAGALVGGALLWTLNLFFREGSWLDRHLPDIRWKRGEEYFARKTWVNGGFVLVYAVVIGWLWLRWLGSFGLRQLRRLRPSARV